MAKRLTDTGKWTNKGFRSLPSKWKLLYLYILDNCDSAGVLNFDIDLIGLIIGEEYTLKEMKKIYAERLTFLSDDKLIIRNYIAFQNGDISDSKSVIAKSIKSTLQTHGLWERYTEGEFGVVNKALTLWDQAT